MKSWRNSWTILEESSGSWFPKLWVATPQGGRRRSSKGSRGTVKYFTVTDNKWGNYYGGSRELRQFAKGGRATWKFGNLCSGWNPEKKNKELLEESLMGFFLGRDSERVHEGIPETTSGWIWDEISRGIPSIIPGRIPKATSGKHSGESQKGTLHWEELMMNFLEELEQELLEESQKQLLRESQKEKSSKDGIQ